MWALGRCNSNVVKGRSQLLAMEEHFLHEFLLFEFQMPFYLFQYQNSHTQLLDARLISAPRIENLKSNLNYINACNDLPTSGSIS